MNSVHIHVHVVYFCFVLFFVCLSVCLFVFPLLFFPSHLTIVLCAVLSLLFSVVAVNEIVHIHVVCCFVLTLYHSPVCRVVVVVLHSPCPVTPFCQRVAGQISIIIISIQPFYRKDAQTTRCWMTSEGT